MNNNTHQVKNFGYENINVVPNFKKHIKEPSINKKDLKFDFQHKPQSNKTQPGTRPENYKFQYSNNNTFNNQRNNQVKVQGGLPPQTKSQQNDHTNDVKDMEKLNQQNKPFHLQQQEYNKGGYSRDMYTPMQVSNIISHGQKMQMIDMNVGHGGTEEDRKRIEERSEWKDTDKSRQGNQQMKQGHGVQIEGLKKRTDQKKQPGNPFMGSIIEKDNSKNQVNNRQQVNVNSSQQNNQHRQHQSEVKSHQPVNHNRVQQSGQQGYQQSHQTNKFQPQNGMQRKTSQAEFYVSSNLGSRNRGQRTTNYQTVSKQGDRREIKLKSQRDSVINQVRSKLHNNEQLLTKEQIQRDTESIKQRFNDYGFNLRQDHGDYKVYRVNEKLFNPEPRKFQSKDIKVQSSIVNKLPPRQFSQRTVQNHQK